MVGVREGAHHDAPLVEGLSIVRAVRGGEVRHMADVLPDRCGLGRHPHNGFMMIVTRRYRMSTTENPMRVAARGSCAAPAAGRRWAWRAVMLALGPALAGWHGAGLAIEDRKSVV